MHENREPVKRERDCGTEGRAGEDRNVDVVIGKADGTGEQRSGEGRCRRKVMDLERLAGVWSTKTCLTYLQVRVLQSTEESVLGVCSEGRNTRFAMPVVGCSSSFFWVRSGFWRIAV